MMATFLQKMKLLKGLLTGEMAYAEPFYVTAEPTRRCNLQCLGCRFHSPKINIPSVGEKNILDISLDLFEALCQELRTMDTEGLLFIGEGEPFLHPIMLDMISMAKTMGLHVTAFTNGTLLDRDTIRSLLRLRLGRRFYLFLPSKYRTSRLIIWLDFLNISSIIG